MAAPTPQDFTRRLSREKLSKLAFNPYARTRGAIGTANAIRRGNLERYLEDMAGRTPRLLLIGEAPSHRGARLTGVPFMSEQLLITGIDSCGMFGSSRGYAKTSETGKPSTEASATIVWSTIRDVRPLPLLWNAFPFHPHEKANPFSNRMPGSAELKQGEVFIGMLMEMFPIETVVAIGRRAEASLCRLGIRHERVRHPSQGGKPLFVQGLRAILAASPSQGW